MKFLQIGLGSMGKRRIRCLKSLGYNNILAFDLREDRRKESEDKYGIKTTDNISNLNFDNIDAVVISVPPDIHNKYIKLAIEKEKPAFVEASVVIGDLENLNLQAKEKDVFIAPSCTLRFHPAIKDVKEIVRSGKYGKITNFSYHSGQYLSDWHPWEDVKDYYVSKKETGGCREIVPFELTWIVDVIGFPKDIFGFYGKTMDVGADIDDTYSITMDFGDCYGNLMVDVVSRYAVRGLVLNMEYGQILWRWDESIVKLYDAINTRWIHYHASEGKAAEGYNKNIIEDMYIDEIKAFIEGIKYRDKFQNSLDDDIKILKLLCKAEEKR
ncbi:Oxidoreductase domain protein [groundwater metagenome]|uniref:Oxidoreductase domain protein n=1 Tax=groundwater metagenome TaxID=717931 RepID=A0A098EC46_9ZZZZ